MLLTGTHQAGTRRGTTQHEQNQRGGVGHGERAYLEHLADIAGPKHLVHVGELVRLCGREVGREHAPGRAPPPQQLAGRAWRRRARTSSSSSTPRRPPADHRYFVPHRARRQEPGAVSHLERGRDSFSYMAVAKLGGWPSYSSAVCRQDGAGWLAGAS